MFSKTLALLSKSLDAGVKRELKILKFAKQHPFKKFSLSRSAFLKIRDQKPSNAALLRRRTTIAKIVTENWL
jgi:hypothetical protein